MSTLLGTRGLSRRRVLVLLLAVSLVLLILASPALAAEGFVSGLVTASGAGATSTVPAVGLQISAYSPAEDRVVASTLTGPSGAYRLAVPIPGEYQVTTIGAGPKGYKQDHWVSNVFPDTGTPVAQYATTFVWPNTLPSEFHGNLRLEGNRTITGVLLYDPPGPDPLGPTGPEIDSVSFTVDPNSLVRPTGYVQPNGSFVLSGLLPHGYRLRFGPFSPYLSIVVDADTRSADVSLAPIEMFKKRAVTVYVKDAVSGANIYDATFVARTDSVPDVFAKANPSLEETADRRSDGDGQFRELYPAIYAIIVDAPGYRQAVQSVDTRELEWQSIRVELIPETTTPPTTTPPTTPPPVAGEDTFADVPASHPYRTAIEGMAQAGIIAGYVPVNGVRNFGPEDNVLRAQFAKMIVGSLNLAANEGMSTPFTDLGSDDPASLYPHEFVAAAYGRGIIKGFSATSFGPYREITRAQVMTMVVRALEALQPGTLNLPPAGYRGSLGNFSPDHARNLQVAEFNGLLAGLVGYGPGWDPWQTMNRGEVAQVLWTARGR